MALAFFLLHETGLLFVGVKQAGKLLAANRASYNEKAYFLTRLLAWCVWSTSMVYQLYAVVVLVICGIQLAWFFGA